MQIYNSAKKGILFSLCFIFIFKCLFAQTLPLEMPEMPSMPEVSIPKIGDAFYYPTVPALNHKKEEKKQEENSNQEKEVEKDDKINSSADLLKRLVSQDDYLTASDISSLYDYGMFSNIGGLNGNALTGTTSSTNLLLQQMISSLDELKEEQKKVTAAAKEEFVEKKHDKEIFSTREAAILRFKINNLNIKDSLTQVFFSEAEEDGSFLLTGDRKYVANQKSRNETFYFLFKSIKSNGAVTTYQVIPSLAQDYENTNSYVYKLCQKENITAEKTGNFVVMHFSDENLNVDLLLDIDK